MDNPRKKTLSRFDGANIVINSNPNGPFVSGFKDFLGVGASDRVYRALTIIHELGHALNIRFGLSASPIVDDSASGEVNRQNSRKVYAACFSPYRNLSFEGFDFYEGSN